CMGLSIDAEKKQVRFAYPALPPFLNEVTIRDLKIGNDCAADIVLKRYDQDVAVSVLRKEGGVEVVIVK
ncbi:MAG TPA: hypothetical protein DDY22_14965, partial [Geobacter sp.]|nr:hypothetical protein [Geobacter sp.]